MVSTDCHWNQSLKSNPGRDDRIKIVGLNIYIADDRRTRRRRILHLFFPLTPLHPRRQPRSYQQKVNAVTSSATHRAEDCEAPSVLFCSTHTRLARLTRTNPFVRILYSWTRVGVDATRNSGETSPKGRREPWNGLTAPSLEQCQGCLSMV